MDLLIFAIGKFYEETFFFSFLPLAGAAEIILMQKIWHFIFGY